MSLRARAEILNATAKALRRVRIADSDLILIGLSGGADSVALTHALVQLKPRFGFELIAAHLNHGLRDAESDRDEGFVRSFCRDLGIDLYAERAPDLDANAANLEERAREARYRFLHRVADQSGTSRIALAHHADDQAETVLLRLLRGSGVAGLRAMIEDGPGRLFRPLLKIKRDTILTFLREIGAQWAHDSTNDSTAFLRNRIRHELLPMLERHYVLGVRDRLNELAEEMDSLDRYLSGLAKQELSERLRQDALWIGGFGAIPEPLANAVVREFFRERLGNLRRITRAHIAQAKRLCRAGAPSATIDLPGGIQLRRQYDLAVIQPRTPVTSNEPFQIVLKLEKQTLVLGNGFALRTSINPALTADDPRDCADFMNAAFDLDQLPLPLVVRNHHPGERVAPLGIKGTRKLHDIFIDRKLPKVFRESWPVVALDNIVVWVPGMVRSRSAIITPATKNILYLQAFPPSTGGLARLPENPSTC